MSKLSPDVFSIDEVARSAGVPLDVVRAAVERGELPVIPGTRFFALEHAAKAAGHLRYSAIVLHSPQVDALFGQPKAVSRDAKSPALASLAVHAALAALALWLSTDPLESAAIDAPVRDSTRLVFLQLPGPGGGGGGGGLRQPRPAPQLARRGELVLKTSTPPMNENPTMSTPAEETLPSPPANPVVPEIMEELPKAAPPIAAPIQVIAADRHDQAGTVGRAVQGPDSRGPGAGRGVGSNRGTGDGDGVGAGIGDGVGGGAGGGPYRPGSGVEAPRLLREVKAEYTEEARRRNITGEVLLEVIISRDGTVGSVRVLRGLVGGLDERAASAVRQWRFAPARRRGVPVDVIVEVAIDFNLR